MRGSLRVRCVLFEDRDEAKPWISRRHGGEDEGRGRITWGALEKQRFAGDGTTLDIIDFILRNADYSDAELENIKRLLKRNSTTLTRLLDSSHGRKHLGITIKRENNEPIPHLVSDPGWVIRVLMRIVEDINGKKINTRTLNKEDEIKRYFEELPADLQPTGRKLEAARPFRDITLPPVKGNGNSPTSKSVPSPSPSVATASGSSAVKSRRLPQDRPTLAPKKNPFNLPASEKARQLLKEAGSIVVLNHRIASAFLLRAFIEFAVNKYMDDNGLLRINSNNGKDLELKAKATAVADHAEKNGKAAKKQLSGFRNMISGNASSISIERLNAFVHQDYQIPAADALIAGWEHSVPVFIATFGLPT